MLGGWAWTYVKPRQEIYRTYVIAYLNSEETKMEFRNSVMWPVGTIKSKQDKYWVSPFMQEKGMVFSQLE